MNKQTIHFDMELFQGYTCIGCAVINDLELEVEFTDDEIALMEQLVSQLDEDYSEGIMPMLKDAAPDLYDRMERAARKEIFDFFVSDGISQGYIEFDEDELRANFKKDLESGEFIYIPCQHFSLDENPTDEEIEENMYDEWYDEEMSRINSEGLEWIRSRYSVDNQVSMEDYTPDYTVDIPVDFLP